MAKKKKTAALGDLGGFQHSGQNSEDFVFSAKISMKQPSMFQLTVYGNAEPISIGRVKQKESKRARRKGEEGWAEIYAEAVRYYNLFTYERPDILEDAINWCCCEASRGRIVHPDRDLRYLKRLHDWTFTNSANPVLVRLIKTRKSELGDFIKQADSKFDSEQMPWEKMIVVIEDDDERL